MLDQSLRAAILELHKKGHSIRPIARMMKVSRDVVRKAIRGGTPEVPQVSSVERPSVRFYSLSFERSF